MWTIARHDGPNHLRLWCDQLFGCGAGGLGTARLGEALAANRSLTELGLGSCGVTGTGVLVLADGLCDGKCSRRRDCHLMAPRCAFIRYFNRDKQGGVIKMTVSPTARQVARPRPAK